MILSADDAFLLITKRFFTPEVYKASPRGINVYEFRFPLITKLNPLRCMMTLKHRKVNYRFMAAELVWILSGDESPWICDYLKAWSTFLDVDVDGNKKLMGAYGPRLRKIFKVDQLKYVIDTLKKDPFSRQAIMTISNPEIDHKGWKDYPCTQSFQFQIRDNELNMTVVMRSNDIYKGATYDWFNFAAIQCIIASILKVKPGAYFHCANNLHMYESDIDKIQNIISNPEIIKVDGFPSLDSISYNSLEEVDEEVKHGKSLSTGLPTTNGFVSNLLKYMSHV